MCFYSLEVFVAGYSNKDKCNDIVHMFKFFNVRLFVPLSNLLHSTKTERKIVNLNIFSFKMHADNKYPSLCSGLHNILCKQKRVLNQHMNLNHLLISTYFIQFSRRTKYF